MQSSEHCHVSPVPLVTDRKQVQRRKVCWWEVAGARATFVPELGPSPQRPAAPLFNLTQAGQEHCVRCHGLLPGPPRQGASSHGLDMTLDHECTRTLEGAWPRACKSTVSPCGPLYFGTSFLSTSAHPSVRPKTCDVLPWPSAPHTPHPLQEVSSPKKKQPLPGSPG